MDDLPTSDSPTRALRARIERALEDDYPEVGVQQFSDLCREGFRHQITDALLDDLTASSDEHRIARIIGLIWALHGTGGGIEPEGKPRIQPTVSLPSERISAHQLQRLIKSARRELRTDLMDDYMSAIDAIGCVDELDDQGRHLLEEYCHDCIKRGSVYARERATYTLRELQRFGSG